MHPTHQTLDFSPPPVGQSVPLDELQTRVLSGEPDLSQFGLSFFGWFFLVLGISDLTANAFGVPLVSGCLCMLLEISSMQYAGVVVVVIQLIVILTGGILLFHSRWRVWIGEIGKQSRAGNSFWNGALISARPAARSWQVAVVFAGVIVATILVSVNLLVGLLILLAGAILLALAFGFDFLKLVFERVVADRESLSGAIVACAVSALMLVFVASPRGFVDDFFNRSWSQEPFVWFRLYELAILAIMGLWIGLLAHARWNNDYLIFVTAPNDLTRAGYDFSAIVKFAGRPVIANLDMVLMREVLILKQCEGGEYETISPTRSLRLNEAPHIILHLPALTRMTERFPLHDRRGLFDAEAEFFFEPQGFQADKIGVRIPKAPVAALMSLLNSDNLADRLRHLAQQGFDNLIRDVDGVGEQMDVAFAQLLGEVDDVLLQVDTSPEFTQPTNAIRPTAMSLGLVALERKHTALSLLSDIRQRGNQILEDWLKTVTIKVEIRDRIQKYFSDLVCNRYLRDAPSAGMVYQQLGLSLNVFLQTRPGGANTEMAHVSRGEALAIRLNEHCRDVRNLVTEQLAASQQQVVAAYAETMKLAGERERLALQNLFAMLPQLFPYFRNRPDKLMRFIEFAVRQIDGPVTFENVRTLLANSHDPSPNHNA